MKISTSWSRCDMAFRDVTAYKRERLHFKLKFSFFSSLSFPLLLLLLFLVVLPFFFILFYSLINVKDNKIYLTIENFSRFLSNPDFFKVLGLSLYYALICTIVCILLAYPFAYFMVKCSPLGRNIMNMLITLPMWTNLLLRVVAWKQLLDEGGIIPTVLNFFGFGKTTLLGTDFAVILVMVYVYLPFMILPIYTQLLKIDKNLKEASKDLGANGVKTFAKVTLPLSLPGVISGFTMVFLPAATTLVIPKYMSDGNPKYTFIGQMIESFFINADNRYAGSAIAVVLTIVIIITSFIVNRFDTTNVKDERQSRKKSTVVVGSEEERSKYEKKHS